MQLTKRIVRLVKCLLGKHDWVMLQKVYGRGTHYWCRSCGQTKTYRVVTTEPIKKEDT